MAFNFTHILPFTWFIGEKESKPETPIPIDSLLETDLGKLIEGMEELNAATGNEFKKEEFLGLEATKPPLPTHPTRAIVLAAYWPAGEGLTSLQRSVRNMCNIPGRSVIEDADHLKHFHPFPMPNGPECLAPYAKPFVGVRWEEVDLASDIGESCNVRLPQERPHIAMFAAARQHPRWVRNIGHEGVPNVWVPGLFRIVLDPAPKVFIPTIEDNEGRMIVAVRREDTHSSSLAVPRLITPAA